MRSPSGYTLCGYVYVHVWLLLTRCSVLGAVLGFAGGAAEIEFPALPDGWTFDEFAGVDPAKVEKLKAKKAEKVGVCRRLFVGGGLLIGSAAGAARCCSLTRGDASSSLLTPDIPFHHPGGQGGQAGGQGGGEAAATAGVGQGQEGERGEEGQVEGGEGGQGSGRGGRDQSVGRPGACWSNAVLRCVALRRLVSFL